VRFTPGTSDVDREVRVLDSEMWRDERPHIERLLGSLQQATTPDEYFELQGDLLVRIRARQVVMDDLRRDIGDLKAERSQLTKAKPVDIGGVRELSDLIDRFEFTLHISKALQHALRCVGDGMAWKALKFDRAGISVLGGGPPVRRLADDVGFRAELAEAGRHWEERGAFAIHNDLTNCLRTGDLTLPFEPGTVGIQEVKVSGRLDPRQQATLERRLQLLREGTVTELMGADRVRLARYDVRYRSHVHRLRTLFSGARRDGYASVRLGSAMAAAAVDPRTSKGDPGIDVFLEQSRAEAGWYDDPRIITFLSFVRRIRERMHFFPYIAPWTIYPLDLQDLSDLLLGPLEYAVTIHAPTLERLFRERGIKAHVYTGDEEANRTFLVAERGDSEVRLPALVREQVLSELLDLSTIVDSTEAMLGDIDAGAESCSTIVVLPDEKRTWIQSA
jgi:hypothetical protein